MKLLYNARAYINMRASYDSIDNKQNVCGKINFSTLKLRYNARAYIFMRASYDRIDNKHILGNPKECVSVIILRKRK